jgi:hypothetical protein
MARITRKEQIEERRQQAWLNWNQGLNHSEIAVLLKYPRRTISNDIALMKQRREQERRRKAELQEHEAKEVLEEARVTLNALKKQALFDFNALSITPRNKDDQDWDASQAESKKDLYSIRMALEDARIELALMSDRLEQKEALQRIKAKSDSLATELNRLEEKALIIRNDNSRNGTISEESQIV